LVHRTISTPDQSTSPISSIKFANGLNSSRQRSCSSITVNRHSTINN